MSDITIRPYGDSDLEPCRTLWAELTRRHREIYGDPSIGGDDPGAYFDDHLDLRAPASDTWKQGPELFGRAFRF
jgi:hypothetical protein